MFNKQRQKRKDDKAYIERLYKQAYLCGYEACRRDYALTGRKGGKGFREGVNDKRNVIRISNKVNKFKNDLGVISYEK